jgi:FAD/FMN-containing dehydrogenase
MTLLDALRASVGPTQVLTDGDLSAYEIDWRKRYHGRALAVVRPGSAAEVAAVVRACAAHGASLVPQGGNTGLVGGGTPDASGTQVLLSLARLNRVRAIDAANLTMTVDAGCVLQAVQEAAAAQQLLFPLSLAAEGSCTIGGNLATNAGGTQVLRYGNARELCLGLEVVTAAGELWSSLAGLRKDNTGYDLRDLFVGSEGTLGVITGATLKLYPQPVAVSTALATVASLQAAVDLLQLAQARLGPGLTAFEVMNDTSLALVRSHFAQLAQPLAAAPWTVLLERWRRASSSRERCGTCASRSRWRRAWRVSTSSTTLPCRCRPCRASSRRPTPHWRTPSPAFGWSTSATWAMATCTTTCRRRSAWRRPISCATTRPQSTRWSMTR